MAQYAEGQHLHGSDGRLYVVHNGVPVVAPPTPLISSPTLPGELQAQQDTHARTAIEIHNAEATSDANVTKARNEAVKSGLDIQSAKTDLNMKTGTPPGDPSKFGDEYVASLPPGVRDLTQAMLGGKYKGLITSSRNPVVVQAALAAQHATHGQFDAGKYDERLAFVKSITDPNSQLGALNTALAHAGVLYDQAGHVAGSDSLGHNPLSIGENALSNWWNSGSPEVTQYKGTLQKYGSEAAKAYGIATGGERQTIEEPYNINLPLDAKQSALANDVKLYMGKIGSMSHQYDMLGGNSPLSYFSPDALAAIQKLAPDEYKKLAQAPSGAQPLPGYAPPPTGPTGGNPAPSTDGFNNTPDPQSAAFWDSAIRNGTPYETALANWQKTPGGKNIITVPDPGQYKAVVDYVHKHPNIPYNPVESFTRTPLGPVAAGMNAVAQNPASTFGVDYYNSLGANIPLALMGDQGARYNAVSGSLNPLAAQLGNVLGTIGGVMGASKGLDAAVEAGKSAPVIGPYLKAMGLVGDDATKVALRRGLTADNLYGATSGAAQDPNNPAAGAALGMAAMTGGNVAGRYLLGPAIRGAQAGANKLGGMFGAQPFQTAAPLDPAFTAILKQSNPAIDAIRGKLSQASDLGLPYALGDADPRLQALTGSAVRKSPDVLALANQALAPRQLGQAERAISLIDTHLAPSGDLAAIQADAKTRAQAASAPLYQKAMQAPVPRDPKIGEMLNTPAGQQAARNAYEIALNSGENPAELSFATAPDGSQITNANPNWKTLQYIKMGMDKVIADNQNQVTGKLDLSDPGNRALNELRARFVNRLGELNPDYRDANAAYSKIINQGSAAQRGYNATAPKVTPDQASIALANQGDNAPSFRQGYASSMADAVNNAQLSGNPYNRVYGTPNQQAKVNMIFPNAGRFGDAYNLENDMAATAREALGGSPTAPRQEADRHFAEGNVLGTGADIAMSTAMGIPPVYALRRGAGFLARDMFRLGIGNAAKNKADTIGPMLLNTDPAAGLQTLDDLQKLSLRRQSYVNRTEAMGGMFAAPTIYGLTQQ